MKQIFEYPYNGNRLTRTGAIISFEAIAGEIDSISINAPNAPSTGDFIFNVQKNGVNLFSGAERITINSASKRVEKNALSIDTNEADILTVTLESVGQAGLLAPVYVIFTIDDGIEAETDIAADIHAADAKTTLVNADEFALVDSAASNALKKLSWQNLKATLKTYFDGLYQAVLVSGTNIKTVNGSSVLGSGNISVSGGASALDDLSDVNLTSPTSGQVLKYNGTNWVNGADSTGDGGSGGGNGFALFAKPSSGVHAKSDYFEGDEFDSKWLDFHADVSTFSVLDGAARCQQASMGDAMSGKVQELTSGDFTIIARMFYPSSQAAFFVGGISLHENPIAAPNTSNILTCEIFSDGSSHIIRQGIFNDWQTFSSAVGGITQTLNSDEYNPIYLMLTRTGTSIEAKFSKNGRFFNNLTSISQASLGYTPTHFGFHINSVGTGSTGRWSFDLIHYAESYKAGLPGGII